MASYRVAAPDEYLAITGMGVKSVKICKSAWVFPFQRCQRFSVQPHDYAMNLQAMTKEKLQFLLPVVFTVGPDVNQRGANSNATGVHEAHQQQQQAQSGNGSRDLRREDRGDALMKYAMLLADSANENVKNRTNDRQFLENIVKGIIEGETRVLVSSMTMEEIFTEREEFKRRIFRNIQSELDQFGLKIYNANVKELKDAPESNYFASLSLKAHEGATNQARIDVAEAQLRGNVGEAQRKGEQDREIAKINAETAVQKTDRDIERSQAEANLETRRVGLNRDVDIARIEAERATQSKDEDLKRQVEVKRAAAELERLRARDVVKASIERESKQQAADARAYETTAEATAAYDKSQKDTDAKAYMLTKHTDAEAYKKRIDADAKAYETTANATAAYDKSQKNTEAEAYNLTKHTDAQAYKTRTEADAYNYAATKRAEADLVARQTEAQGLAAMADAYGRMSQALGGPHGLLAWMMIEKGTYVQLAKANASAVQGMQPKISVWNTGSQAGVEGGGQGAGIDTMRNVYQMLPPLMTTINEQTGITLPEWQFGRMAGQMSEIERAKDAKVNGNKA